MEEYRTIAAIIYIILQRDYILMFMIANKDLNTKLDLNKVSLGGEYQVYYRTDKI